jgi:hypothetical protein
VPVTSKLPEIIAEPVNGKGETYPSKYEAVKAYDAVVAFMAYDEVPNKDPVIPPFTTKDPVIVVLLVIVVEPET